MLGVASATHAAQFCVASGTALASAISMAAASPEDVVARGTHTGVALASVLARGA